MTDTAIFDTTRALHTRIASVVGGAGQVHIGAPIRNEIGTARVSLFLFHCDVNASLRNQLRSERPPPNQPAGTQARRVEALPMDLRYLITVFREPDASVQTPNELEKLGQIIQVLHVLPTLSGPSMRGQVVRVSPEPYPMEEMSRIWGLFGQAEYRSSIVYMATPVFIDAGLSQAGSPVIERRQSTGPFVEELAVGS